MPALGFGTLIPDAAGTISATSEALEAGFRHFDCAERYRNEREVGEASRVGRVTWHVFAYNPQGCGSRPGESQPSPPFRKTRLTKSIAFKSDRGSMKCEGR